jgi:antitoxin ParD1/3/4
MNISIPKPIKAWLEEQIEKGGYASASEYIGELLRAEQNRKIRDRVDSELRSALDSGPATPMTADDWEEIRRQGQKRLRSRKKRAR